MSDSFNMPVTAKIEPSPSEESASVPPPPQPPPPPTRGSKRKAVSTACIPCRKRKSKASMRGATTHCDGGTPSCSTCLAVYRTECSYDQDADHRRKGALRKDIQSLQHRNNALEVVVRSMCTLPEDEAFRLFQGLRRGEMLDALAESVESGEPHAKLGALDADLMEQAGDPAHVIPMNSASTLSAGADEAISPGGMSGSDPWSTVAIQGPASWFRVPQDAEFIDHLLNLYFTWSHPVHTIFLKEPFIKDMQCGRTQHCSVMLVNAVLALACHYSDRPTARSDPSLAHTAGDYFFQEALEAERHVLEPTLTTIQALGLMALREASVGREQKGYRYAGRCMRMAMEMKLHLECSPKESGLRPAEIEARKLTFWTAFNLEIPSSLTRDAFKLDKPTAPSGDDVSMWEPYYDEALPQQPDVAPQPMRTMLFLNHYGRLSEILNNINLDLYKPRERFTARRLASAHQTYQNWYNDLPEELQLAKCTMPHIAMLHLTYHMGLLHLFRPFMKLDLSAMGVFPHSICTYSAGSIAQLVGGLKSMYGLRYVPITATVALQSAALIYLFELPAASAAATLGHMLDDLYDLSHNQRFAALSLGIIKEIAARRNITLPPTTRGEISRWRDERYGGHGPGGDDGGGTDVVQNIPFLLTEAMVSNDGMDSAVAAAAAASSTPQQQMAAMAYGLSRDGAGSAGSRRASGSASSVTALSRHDSSAAFEPSFVPLHDPILPAQGYQYARPELDAEQQMQMQRQQMRQTQQEFVNPHHYQQDGQQHHLHHPQQHRTDRSRQSSRSKQMDHVGAGVGSLASSSSIAPPPTAQLSDMQDMTGTVVGPQHQGEWAVYGGHDPGGIHHQHHHQEGGFDLGDGSVEHYVYRY